MSQMKDHDLLKSLTTMMWTSSLLAILMLQQWRKRLFNIRQ